MKYSKPIKIKSTKIRQSAKGEYCRLRIAPVCASNETVVLCHAPSAGKGVGTKSDDFWAVYGCSSCHNLADAGNIDASDWLRAIYETQKALFSKGLLWTK
jgi:hypothetical protein